MFGEQIQGLANVRIIGRERGKRVPKLCREDHNIWVNIGRQYLAEVIAPKDSNFNAHYSDIGGTTQVVKWMGLGIGGDSQIADIALTYPTLDAHYPGLNTFDDETITASYMERPIKVSGTAGTGTSPGVWMSAVAAPPTFSGTPIHIVEFMTLFTEPDLHLGGAYPAVPLSECALMLAGEVSNLNSDDVYDYATPPYVGASRQRLIAYNTFTTLTKTSSVALEIHWQIQF
jgi:hypothetical protein